MKRFLTKKDLKLKKKQTVYTVIGIIVIIAVYWFLTREKAVEPEAPVVSVTPAQQQDVEIYGEYVGRIRAQQWKVSLNRCYSPKVHTSRKTKCFS